MIVDEYEARVRIAEARIAFLNEFSDGNDVFKQVVNQNIREVIELSVKKLPPPNAHRLSAYVLQHDLIFPAFFTT